MRITFDPLDKSDLEAVDGLTAWMLNAIGGQVATQTVATGAVQLSLLDTGAERVVEEVAPKPPPKVGRTRRKKPSEVLHETLDSLATVEPEPMKSEPAPEPAPEPTQAPAPEPVKGALDVRHVVRMFLQKNSTAALIERLQKAGVKRVTQLQGDVLQAFLEELVEAS